MKHFVFFLLLGLLPISSFGEISVKFTDNTHDRAKSGVSNLEGKIHATGTAQQEGIGRVAFLKVKPDGEGEYIIEFSQYDFFEGVAYLNSIGKNIILYRKSSNVIRDIMIKK